MKKIILFQGDSITDAGRDRSKELSKGMGYACMASGAIGAEYPDTYTIYNRGVSGNRVVDLFARIRCDMINLAPDYMSILVGVNDVWHGYTKNNGVDAKKYELVYDLMIQELKEALPNLKIMILEPFVLPGTATENTEEHPNRWEYFREGVRERAEAAKRVAQKHGLLFVPLQEMFTAACEKAPAACWLADGVHPTAGGHELIKREWLKAFEELK